jgi:adenine phosphoribosyltransferase
MSRDLRQLIRDVPDFPKPGILFRDITTLLKDPAAFREVLERMARPFAARDVQLVAGIESRGFMLGAPLADRMGAGFVPIRKKGRLPSETLSRAYSLEYGTDGIEIHRDAVEPGTRVLLVDDLLATGGTAQAALALLREARADILGAAFLVELADLGGRHRLENVEVLSLVRYDEGP